MGLHITLITTAPSFLSEMLTIVAASYALTVGLNTDDNVNVLYIFQTPEPLVFLKLLHANQCWD